MYFACGCTAKLQSQQLRQVLVLHESRADHNVQALASITRCGANDPGRQDNVTPRIAVDQAVAHLHRDGSHTIHSFVRALPIGSSQMGIHEFLAAPTVHCQVELQVRKFGRCLGTIRCVDLLLLDLEQVMLGQCVLPNRPKRERHRGTLVLEVLALWAATDVDQPMELHCRKLI